MKMPDRIWAGKVPNNFWTRYATTPEETAVGGFQTYLRSTPAREHAEEMVKMIRRVFIEFGWQSKHGELLNDMANLLATIGADNES